MVAENVVKDAAKSFHHGLVEDSWDAGRKTAIYPET
jgi:hypothetical protein